MAGLLLTALLPLTAFVLLTVGNAFFVAAEFGLVTVDRAEIESRGEGGDRGRLREDVRRHLRPIFRNLHVFHFENDGPVRVYDARGARRERNGGKGIIPLAGKAAWNVHWATSCK